MTELDRTLHLADGVLRHKVIRIADRPPATPRPAFDRLPRRPGQGRPLSPPRRLQQQPAPTRTERKERCPTETASPWSATSPATPSCASPPSGQATASFGLAVNRVWNDRQTNERKEAVSFFDVVCWREMAENVSESLSKGARVLVTGRLEQRSWESPDGERRSKIEVVADEIGPSLRWATAEVRKNDRRGPSDGPGGGGGQAAAARRRPGPGGGQGGQGQGGQQGGRAGRQRLRPGRRPASPDLRLRGGTLLVKIILRADVDNVGKKGDVVDVSDGFARNYLVAKGLALKATAGAVAQAAAMRRSRDLKDARDREAAEQAGQRPGAHGHPHPGQGRQPRAGCSGRSPRPTW